MTTIGSLFSGIGGLDLGLERAGLGRVVWQAERDTYCQAVLRRHWPDAVIYDDVRRIDERATRVAVLCGGFPCQPVSLAGARLAQADERWLWPEFVRIARALEPAVVIAENVPGLRSAGLRDVLADLAALGFDAEWTCLAAGGNPRRTHGWPHVGAPHERRRIFLVATHPDRTTVRGEPGWLGRSLRTLASVSRDAREAWASTDSSRLAVGERAHPSWGRVSDAAWSGGGEDAVETADDAHGEYRIGRDAPSAQRRTDADCASRSAPTVGVAANVDGQGQSQPRGTFGEQRGWASDSGWGHAPPAVRGVDDGTPDGLDGAGGDDGRGDRDEASEPASQAPDSWRVSACGNAVLPQCAELVGRAVVSSVEFRT